MKGKVFSVIIAKPDDGDGAGSGDQHYSDERRNDGAAAPVAVALEFIAYFVPFRVGIPVAAQLPHERRRACAAGNNCHVQLSYIKTIFPFIHG